MAAGKKTSAPKICPCCGGELHTAELRCGDCGVVLRGDFAPEHVGGGILSLGRDELAFAEIFLRCSGNLREVQTELGQSYPTIKKQLDRVVAALNRGDSAREPVAARPMRSDESENAVISAMREGRLTVDEAVAELTKLKADKNGGKAK